MQGVLLNFRNFLTIGAFSLLIAVGIIFIKPKSSSINVIGGSTLPLTGTFIVPDLFYSSASDYDRLFEELQDANINLVVLTLTGYLTKNCQTGQYIEDSSASRLNHQMVNLINSATKYQMQIFFSVADIPHASDCLVWYKGTVGNETTDKGKVIAYSARTIDAINQLLSDKTKIPNTPNVGGYYIAIEVDSLYLAYQDAPYLQLSFFRDMANMIKTKTGKMVMMSPFQMESTDYATSKKAFDNVFGTTQVDIIAATDSIGVGITQTTQASTAHYQALSDSVANYPGKLAWANIETFGPGPTGDTYVSYAPANSIGRIKNQISSANKPNISKMITWMYTHTMMINPASDNMASKNQYATMYTPAKATARRALRDAYFTAYNATSKFNLASPVTIASPSSSQPSTPKPSPTPSATPASPSNHKLADLDHDGSVGLSDYNLIRRDFTKTGSPGFSPADLQADGRIDLFDYNVLVQNYGK